MIEKVCRHIAPPPRDRLNSAPETDHFRCGIGSFPHGFRVLPLRKMHKGTKKGSIPDMVEPTMCLLFVCLSVFQASSPISKKGASASFNSQPRPRGEVPPFQPPAHTDPCWVGSMRGGLTCSAERHPLYCTMSDNERQKVVCMLLS